MVPLLFIGSFAIAFLLAFGLNHLSLIPWRRSVGQHWTERARLLHPARKSARLNNWLIPVILGVLDYFFFPDIHFLIPALAGFFGALAAGYFFSREVVPELPFNSWIHLVAASLIYFFVRLVIFVIAAFTLPQNFGPVTWIVTGCLLVLLMAFNFGLGLRLLRWVGLFKPATNHLETLVTEVSQKMNVPVRGTWILSTYISNAVAFPLTRELAFTDKLLSTLSDDQIKAVCAHELGHLNEPRSVVFIRALVPLGFYPFIFARPCLSLGENGVIVYALLVIGGLILTMLGRRISQRMEKRADKIAVENMVDATVYARALERLYETNLVPAVTGNRSNKIHPDLYDRMIAAGVTPDFPKPRPAAGLSWTAYFMFAVLVLILVFVPVVKFAFQVVEASTIHIN